MEYQALYRKYRPKSLKDVVGQDVVTSTIGNSLKNNTKSHAYLFSGPRGTGKTTMAKILAKNINCLALEDGEACNKCTSCLEINNKESVDIIEIDAASNNGIDEIREIRNKINLVPSKLKYKVYIIDEVHMLTIGAFNALLKTLEEPPLHVLFILATTDVHKVPITIISRCQCMNFKRISVDKIIERLKIVLKEEQIHVSDEILNEIAIYSDGGMRDSLGMLDKLISYKAKDITIDDFRILNGLISTDEIVKFIKNIKESNYDQILSDIDNYYSNGRDLVKILENVLLVIKDEIVKMIRNSQESEVDYYIELSNTLNEIIYKLKDVSNPKLFIEMTLLQFINKKDRISGSKAISIDEKTISIKPVLELEPVDDNPNLIIKQTEQKQEQTNLVSTEQGQEQTILVSTEQNREQTTIVSTEQKLKEIRINNTLALADKENLKKLETLWKKFKELSLDSKIGSLSSFLSDGNVVAASNKNIIIAYDYDSSVQKGMINLKKIEVIIKEHLKIDVKPIIITVNEWNEIKNKYIDNKKMQIAYSYIDEEAVVSELDVINNQENVSELSKLALDLFGKKMVTIGE